MPRLRIDAPLGLREISSDVIEGLGRLGPFGAANPEAGVPRRRPSIWSSRRERLKDRHLSLLVQAGRPVVPRHRLARRRARGVSDRESLRPRAGVFARPGRIPRRDDDRADRRRRPRARGDPGMRWQRPARFVLAAIGIGARWRSSLFLLSSRRRPRRRRSSRPMRRPWPRAAPPTTVWFGKSERRARFSYKRGPGTRTRIGCSTSTATSSSRTARLTINAADAEIRGDTTNAAGPTRSSSTATCAFSTATTWSGPRGQRHLRHVTGIVTMPGAGRRSRKGRMSGQASAASTSGPQEKIQLEDQAP